MPEVPDWLSPETAVRAYAHLLVDEEAEKAKEAKERRGRRRRPAAARPGRLLVLDCETSTDGSQRLRFAVARLYESQLKSLAAHGARPAQLRKVSPYDYLCRRELIAVADDLPAEEVETIRRYLAGQWHCELNDGALPLPQAGRNESGVPIELVSLEELRELIYREAWRPATQGKRRPGQEAAMVVGFNLVFDLTRIALRVNPSKRVPDAFTATYWTQPDNDRSHPYRPQLQIKKIGSKAHLMQWTDAQDAENDPRSPSRFFKGHFLDTAVLYWSLFSKTASLAQAARDLKTAHAKLETEEHGDLLSAEYVHYARQDALVTFELTVALLRRFDEHPFSGEYPGRPAADAAGRYLRRGSGRVPIEARQGSPRSLPR